MSNVVLDRVHEAYSGAMGDEFSKQTRNRVNWIVNHTEGDNILDIGCSQGIVPIILGREGKKVLGIDLAEKSIDYAKTELQKEHETVQSNVNFITANFMTYTGLSDGYDTIIFTEVLEHIADTKNFLKRISELLTANGTCVVTVPFGINDYFDHKRTYYFLELFDQLNMYFHIEKFEYLGKWTGVICKKSSPSIVNEKKTTFERDVIANLEKAFYHIEREYVTKVDTFLKQISQKNNELKRFTEKEQQRLDIDQKLLSIEESLQKTQTELQQKIDVIHELSHQNVEALENLKIKNDQYLALQSELKEREAKIAELKEQHEEMKKIVLERLDSEEEVLNALLKKDQSSNDIQQQYLALNEKYLKLERKYNSLKNSKLGKFTLWYWSKRRKFSK